MGNHGDTSAILAAAERYVIQKSDHGITVGLHFGGAHYGEAHSPRGDLDGAVRLAFEQVRRRLETQSQPDSATPEDAHS